MRSNFLPVFIITVLLCSSGALAQNEAPPPNSDQNPPELSDERNQQGQEQLPPEVSMEQVSPPVPSSTEQPGAISIHQNKISLDIKGMDIIDVLKMLSVRSGMNMAVGRNVTGRVTLFLKDVDVWDAFEIIILANDLAYDRKGGIINVMTQRDYELLYGERYQDKKQAKLVQLKYAKGADLSKALNQIKSNVGRVIVDEGSNTLVLVDAPQKIKDMEGLIAKADMPLETRIYGLNYAQAEKISPKIQEAITKGVGSMRVDERTNKIAITDYPERLDDIGKIIKAFDAKTPQVLIDAQIIDIKPSDSFKMGVDWNFWIEKHFQIAAPLGLATGGSGLVFGTPGSPTSASASAPSDKNNYKYIIDLLRTIGDLKILTSPRIMVLNNQEASILVGRKQTYFTSSSVVNSQTTVTTDTPQELNTGIELHVTPTINNDHFVTMKIKPKISTGSLVSVKTNGQDNSAPDMTTAEAETTVMVKDGVTIIMGGLRNNQRDKTVKKIPVLGDLPGIGFLFRDTSDAVTKEELVILLTPHIISGESTFLDSPETKSPNQVEAKMVNGDIVLEKPSKKDSDPGDTSVEYYNFVVKKVQ
ncbi:MAG: hypothetical protein NTU54_07790 [Candidatus Omnitrophica bacterium]|nr:hypothetical protein [Candidatus Omnitrophota bacterium]